MYSCCYCHSLDIYLVILWIFPRIFVHFIFFHLILFFPPDFIIYVNLKFIRLLQLHTSLSLFEAILVSAWKQANTFTYILRRFEYINILCKYVIMCVWIKHSSNFIQHLFVASRTLIFLHILKQICTIRISYDFAYVTSVSPTQKWWINTGFEICNTDKFIR